jgi:hypothetical protein
MEHCTNHPDIKTNLHCCSCGKPFCEQCLTEYGEYLYCKSYECQNKLKADFTKILLPEFIDCPNCLCRLQLESHEQETGIVHCEQCDSKIDFNVTPPLIEKAGEYVFMLSCMNISDVVLIKSILSDAGIDFYFAGENFLSVDPLIQPARLFVMKSEVESVKEILKNFKFHAYGVSKNK